MADKLNFELVSPEKLLVSDTVEMVVVPGTDGNFGVLAKHSPVISTVRPGVIDVYANDRSTRTERIFIAGGFVEVTAERCTVLAETAVPVGEIDVAATEQAIRDLGEDVADAKSDEERDRARNQLTLEQAKLAAAKAA